MRRLGLLLLASAAISATGCKPRDKIRTQPTDESPAQLASVIQLADPNASVQLLRGFHQVEGNSWRWTMSKFALVLKTPANAAARSARLKLRFALPESVLSRTGPVTLSATVGGTTLPPQTYGRTGDHIYNAEVPASALAAETVTCEFAVDKFLAAGTVDQRELGLVVSSAGLEAK